MIEQKQQKIRESLFTFWLSKTDLPSNCLNCLIDRYIIYFCIIGIQIELWHINLKVFFDYIGGEPLVHSIIGSSESRKVFWTEQIISSLFIGTMEEIPSKINKPAWIGMANLATLHKNPLDLKLKKIVNKNSRGKLSAQINLCWSSGSSCSVSGGVVLGN